ncbi:MAG: caspase family protein [Caldilineaceae bacterium]|nr:caspase family protein [Caldilineaceae bacterium]
MENAKKHSWKNIEKPVQKFRQSHALIIGINDYQHGIRPLITAVNDARRLAEILSEKHKYKTHLLTENVTKSKIHEAIVEELQKKVNEHDRVIFYFAGHGIAENDQYGLPAGYLAPQDAKREDRNTFLPMKEVYDLLAALTCRHMLIILDCCFAGRFRWSTTRDIEISPPLIYRERYERFVRDLAWQVITSTSYDQTAIDIFGERDVTPTYSPFASALFRVLEGIALSTSELEDRLVVTATDLYLYLWDAVDTWYITNKLNHQSIQTPEIWRIWPHGDSSKDKDNRGQYVFLSLNQEMLLPQAPVLTLETNPYRGLEPYEAIHSGIFFGREGLTKNLGSVVQVQPLTVVLGPSGSGKSSLVKAGLIPYIRNNFRQQKHEISGYETEDEIWYILPPVRPTESPETELARIISHLSDTENTLQDFSGTPFQYIQSLIGAWFKKYPNHFLLITIDQFDELITLCTDELLRNRYLNLLAELLDQYSVRIRLVLTVRTDFETQFSQSPLSEYWQNGKFPISQMTRSELRNVIEGPAGVCTIFFNPPHLIDELIDSVYQTPGSLPLLSFTLDQLYRMFIDRQTKSQETGDMVERALVYSDYQELGGVIGSISRCAVNQLNSFDTLNRKLLQRIMLRMISAEGNELTRRRIPLTELIYPSSDENLRIEEIIKQLTDMRLLVRSGEKDNTELIAFIEPAHDELINKWEDLEKWYHEAKEYFSLHRRLTFATYEWSKASVDDRKGLLWHDNPGLQQIEDMLSSSTNIRQQVSSMQQPNNLSKNLPWLNSRELEFVRGSLLQRESRKRTRVMLRNIVVFVVIILAILIVFSWQRNKQFQVERIARATEETLRSEAEKNELLAVTSEALAIHARETEESLRVVAEENGQMAMAAEEEAMTAKTEVERLNRSIQADRLTSTALDMVAENPTLAFLLAQEGLSSQYSQRESISASALTNVHKLLSNTRKSITLYGFSEAVTKVAFSPDGGLLAVGSGNIIKLWDTKNYQSEPIVLQTRERTCTRTSSDDFIDSSCSEIKDLTFSPDGRWLAVADFTSLVKLWDLTTPSPEYTTTLKMATRAPSQVTFVAFSENGRWLATGPWLAGSRMFLHDINNVNGNPISFIGQKGFSSLAYSANRQWLVTAAYNGAPISLWNLKDPNKKPVELYENKFTMVPYGSIMVTSGAKLSSSNFSIKIWQLDKLSDDNPVPKLVLNGNGSVSALALSKDERYLAVGARGQTNSQLDEHNIFVWDLSFPEIAPVLLSGHTDLITDLEFSPNNYELVSTSQDATARLWSITKPSQGSTILGGHTDALTDITFSPNGEWLATASQDATVRLWHMGSTMAEPLLLEGPKDWITSLSFSPDGRLLAAGTGHPLQKDENPIDNTAHLWNIHEPDTPIITLDYGRDLVQKVIFSPDGQWFATLDTEKVNLWKLTEPLETLIQLTDPGAVSGLDDLIVSPDSKWLITSGQGKVILWDINKLDESPVVLKLHSTTFGNTDVEVSPDGQWIAFLDSGAIYIWSVENPHSDPIKIMQPVSNLSCFSLDEIRDITFSADSQYIVGASWSNIYLWRTSNPLNYPDILHNASEPVVFSPDGKWLAAQSSIFSLDCKNLEEWASDTDNIHKVFLWLTKDLSSPPITLLGPKAAASVLVFSSDSRWLATAYGRPGWKELDKTIRLWDLNSELTGSTILTGHKCHITALAFSPDNKYLASGGCSEPIRIWGIEPKLLMDNLCNMAGRNMTEDEWVRFIPDELYRSSCFLEGE